MIVAAGMSSVRPHHSTESRSGRRRGVASLRPRWRLL